MSKAVMISIRPRWCELIANGKKTMEVRKTRPKLETPFKCYIYCTAGDDKLWVADAVRRNWWGNKHVAHLCNAKDCGGMNFGNRKVIGEFVCDGIVWLARVGFTVRGGEPEYRIANNGDWKSPIGRLLEEACLTEEEIDAYLGGNSGFGWHISDLKIYDKPKEISEFKKHSRECYFDNLGMATPKCSECTQCNLTRPPQSYCFVEALQT